MIFEMDTISWLFIGFIIFLTTVYFIFTRKPNGFPPGPIPYPILGNIPQLGFNPHESLLEMSKKYGPIISIKLASFQAVVLNDAKIIRKYFALSELNGRPRFDAMDESRLGFTRGLAMSPREHWIEQRRFVIKNMRDFGFGKHSMEFSIQEDVKELVDKLKNRIGTPISTTHEVNSAVLNSLWKIICGENLKQDDPKTQKLLNLVSDSLGNLKSVGLCFFFPKFAKLFPNLTGYKTAVDFQTKTREFVNKMTSNVKSTFQLGDKRSLVDAYFNEITKTTDPHSSFFGSEGEINMDCSILDLITGGSDTTSTTLSWTFLILALHPHIEIKLWEEIDRVVGHSRLPELQDKPNMPYTECFIMEVLRFAPPLPMGIWHKTTQDIIMEGYKIPKDTIIQSNLYGAMHDPKVFSNPETICPERFLLPDGRVDRQNERWIPFSAGKRDCLGATLAKYSLFLFITGLCQQLKFEIDTTSPIPTLQNKPGLISGPYPHRLIIQQRKF